ncbi:MAG: aminopeptidase P family protein [Clostridiales bacterium]|nr:aminopeptidase P family protein [Clostridiales bacterium]
MYLDREKLEVVYRAMQSSDVDAWITVGRETAIKSEPILPVLGDMDFILPTVIVFTKDKCIAVVSPLDIHGYRAIDGVDEAIEYLTLEQGIADLLKQLKPKKLALNYAANDASADGLTHGYWLMMQAVLQEVGLPIEVVSAEPIIQQVRGIKTASQLAAITECCAITMEIFDELTDYLATQEDLTSMDIFNKLQEMTYARGCTTSWSPALCPGVSTGPDYPGGHMGPVEIAVEKGHTVTVDFGVAKNGYCSDHQRTWYILKDDEQDAPEDVKAAFKAVVDGIQKAFDFMRPGVTGNQVDTVAREHITGLGYPDWNASLGHQVGHRTHDGGKTLSPRRNRYNRPELIDVPLDAGQVFTLEPSVPTRCGRVSAEEMCVVEPQGCRWLAPPQKELILVRRK